MHARKTHLHWLMRVHALGHWRASLVDRTGSGSMYGFFVSGLNFTAVEHGTVAVGSRGQSTSGVHLTMQEVAWSLFSDCLSQEKAGAV